MAAGDWAHAAWDETGKPVDVELVEQEKDKQVTRVEMYKNWIQIKIDGKYFCQVNYGYLELYPMEIHVTKVTSQNAVFAAIFYKDGDGKDCARFWIGCYGWREDSDPYRTPPDANNEPTWEGVNPGTKFVFEAWLSDLWVDERFSNPLMKEGPIPLVGMEDKSFAELKYGAFFRKFKDEKSEPMIDYLDDSVRETRVERVMEETPDEPLFKGHPIEAEEDDEENADSTTGRE